MAEKDRIKWNEKYRNKPQLLASRPPSPLLERYCKYTTGKRALDIACGGGRNTLFLAQEGFSVDAVDISSVALDTLARQTDSLSVNLIEADLETFTPAPETYDLAIMANYLDRSLIERIIPAIKPGGIFIVETYMIDEENEKQDSNPAFMLSPGELKGLFSREFFEHLVYEEFWNEPYEIFKMRKQGIVVKKR